MLKIIMKYALNILEQIFTNKCLSVANVKHTKLFIFKINQKNRATNC